MTINVGIIGCGSITEFRHAPEYAANPYVNKLIFYDRNPKRSELLAQKFGGRAVTNIEEIMNDNEIEAISDCSSNETHHLITTEALNNGKHVLCEKPIGVSIEQAEKILQAEKASGKVLMIDHNQRLTKAHQKAKEIIQSGELGKVLSFKTNFGHKGPEYWSVNKSNSTWFFKKDRSFIGVAGDLGIHKIDLVRFLLNDEIVEVSALQGALDKKDENREPIEVCDNVVGILKTEKGALGTASFSWTYYGDEDNSTIIYLEKGIIKIYVDHEAQIDITNAEGEKVKYEIETIQTNDSQTSTGVIDAFVDSIVNNKPSLISGEDGLIALKVVLAMMESAETGKNVKI